MTQRIHERGSRHPVSRHIPRLCGQRTQRAYAAKHNAHIVNVTRDGDIMHTLPLFFVAS